MAQTESKIKLIFEGAERGVAAAAAKSAAAIRSLDDDNSRLSKSADRAGSALGVMGKGMLALGAANGAVQVVGGVAGALTQLAPAALLLPGALLAGAAAMTTYKIATAGFGDALSAGLSGDMKKFAEATKDMAPEMRAAAQEVVAFKPAIDGLKKAVQSNFWGQFSGDITKLGKTYLPVMQIGLTGVSAKLGMMAKSAIATMNTPFFSGRVSSILGDTTKTLDGMSSSAGDVLGSFISIGAIGASYLPRLGTAIGKVTDRFREWTDSAAGQDKIRALIDGAIKGFEDLGGIVKNVGSILGSVFTGLGGVVESPLARIRELTGQVAAFLKTAEAQDGLKALGETLRVVGEVVGRVVMTALRELAPTLVKLAPVAQEVARTLGDLLVNALETLGPIIRGVADVFNDFPGSAGAATVAVVGFVAAIKTIKAVNAVTDLLGLSRVFGGVGVAAETAGKTAGISWGKGLIGGLGLAGAGIGATIILDKILPRDAAVTHGSQVARDMLTEMATVFQGGGTAFQTLDVAQWISNPISMAVEVGKRKLMELFGFKPPPIGVDANIDPATGKVKEFVGGVSRTRGMLTIDGNIDPVTGKVEQAVTFADGSTGTVTVDGNAIEANGKITGAVRLANGSKGTITIDGNDHPANGQILGVVRYANGSTGTVLVNAATRQANADIDSAARNRYSTIFVNVVRSTTGSSAPGAGAHAMGGPIVGPGSGTSDSVPFMGSNGEWVVTAKQVANAGGFAGMARLSAALEKGHPLGLASGGGIRASARAAMRTPTPVSSRSSGGTFQLVAGPGADAAAAAFIASLVRTGKLQLKAA